MFDEVPGRDEQPAARGPGRAVARLLELRQALGRLDGTGLSDGERVDVVRLLEEVKAAASAAQAQVTARFAESQRAEQAARAVPERDRGRGVAAQVALAKRESPARAQRFVGFARILVTELPMTLDELRAGRTTEWRAMLVARETAWLSREHRARVDLELAPRLEGLGDRQVEAEAKKLAYRLDPAAAVARASRAEGDRRVTLRPAPDVMSQLSALLPVAQGVAVYAALGRAADSLRAQGDGRSRGQLMADTLVRRVTGQEEATGVPVEVAVVMTDQSLFGHGPGSDEPAVLPGFGPVPADLARRVAAQAADAAALWLRRFYAAPGGGALVAMESRRRVFGDGLARFLLVRDQQCRTPWCGAPVRHLDHVVRVEDGGPTTTANGQGLCEACNQAKEAPGWDARPGPRHGHDVLTRTPTGHVYVGRAPDPPGLRQPA